MKILTRVAAVVAVLGVAGPALPCGLMQQSADATTPAPTMGRDHKADPKAQVTTAKKTAAVPKKTSVAKN